MSLHYEWTLSLRLRPDTPAPFLDELRFHLGLTERPPEKPELEIDWPCLVTEPDDTLPGGSVRSLVAQRPYLNRPGSFGLFVRTFVLDDAMYELILAVPAWLARWSLTQGWIGQAREELSLHPWLNFYVQDGHAYAAGPGDGVEPLNGSAPPFTLNYTSDTP
ncbi:hypothetical protein ACFQFC_03755 [Amorphoplanes digitatis]|uniref:Uncharacterized protein n=1 Tax=Actinoplanes digitatis TaxID=1868 RepID=A0A7W7MRA5_9ACTN|nr:hypothetical protein [Actinoplanes digitatis]MBB4763294.1 hypothetical protein [Actinoplanes digitatis]GID92113.1 hypothetical protein Adi01nite_15250 [Actinoplanes digitatis]